MTKETGGKVTLIPEDQIDNLMYLRNQKGWNDSILDMIQTKLKEATDINNDLAYLFGLLRKKDEGKKPDSR